MERQRKRDHLVDKESVTILLNACHVWAWSSTLSAHDGPRACRGCLLCGRRSSSAARHVTSRPSLWPPGAADTSQGSRGQMCCEENGRPDMVSRDYLLLSGHHALSLVSCKEQTTLLRRLAINRRRKQWMPDNCCHWRQADTQAPSWLFLGKTTVRSAQTLT